MIGAAELDRAVAETRLERARRLEPEILYRAEPIGFYALERQGGSLAPVVVHDPGAEPEFRLLEQATHDARVDSLYMPEIGLTVELDTVRNAYWQAFLPPEGAAALFEDVALASATFKAEFSHGTRHLLVHAWSLALVLVSTWVVVRLSRWPLLNIFLVLLAARGIFAAFSFVQTETMSDLMGVFLTEEQMHYLLPALFAAASLVLLLVLIVLPPFRQWKREVGSG
jgi:hypothetical protein